MRITTGGTNVPGDRSPEVDPEQFARMLKGHSEIAAAPVVLNCDRHNSILDNCLDNNKIQSIDKEKAVRNSYRSVHTTLLIAGIFLFGCSSLAVSGDNEPKNDQYNHILKKISGLSDGEVDIQIREILFPPSWQAPTHFHSSDILVYVIEGEIELTMEHTGQVVYTAGQVLEMPAKTTMDARNPSNTEFIKLVLFQVGALDSPFMVPVK